jgi:hypothetical protein
MKEFGFHAKLTNHKIIIITAMFNWNIVESGIKHHKPIKMHS